MTGTSVQCARVGSGIPRPFLWVYRALSRVSSVVAGHDVVRTFLCGVEVRNIVVIFRYVCCYVEIFVLVVLAIKLGVPSVAVVVAR